MAGNCKKIAVKIKTDKETYSYKTVDKDYKYRIEITHEHTLLEIKKNKNQVFICYSSYNQVFANEVYEKLKNEGINVWMDIDKIKGGDNWRNEIETALIESDIVLILLDKKSVKSHYVTYEWAFALGNKKEDMVIPLILEDCKMHKRIDRSGMPHHIDFSKDKNWTKLIENIKSKLNT